MVKAAKYMQWAERDGLLGYVAGSSGCEKLPSPLLRNDNHHVHGRVEGRILDGAATDETHMPVIRQTKTTWVDEKVTTHSQHRTFRGFSGHGRTSCSLSKSASEKLYPVGDWYRRRERIEWRMPEDRCFRNKLTSQEKRRSKDIRTPLPTLGASRHRNSVARL